MIIHDRPVSGMRAHAAMTVVRPCGRRHARWQRSFRSRVDPSLTFRWHSWQGPEAARSEIGPEAPALAVNSGIR
jgi:hypothetical protein